MESATVNFLHKLAPPRGLRETFAVLLFAGMLVLATGERSVQAADSAAPPANRVYRGTWSAPDEIRVPLKLVSGVPCIQARVNGAKVMLAVDTGNALAVVLESDTAAKAGIQRLTAPSGGVTAGGVLGAERL